MLPPPPAPRRYLTAAFPRTTIIAKNGAVPATPSSYATMCLELMVEEDVDIVFVEYALNDGPFLRLPSVDACLALLALALASLHKRLQVATDTGLTTALERVRVLVLLLPSPFLTCVALALP